MTLNLSLALVAAICWFGAFFWYFRGGERIKADITGLARRMGLRRKAASDDQAAGQ